MAHLYTYLCIIIIISVTKKSNHFPCQCYHFICQCYLFLTNVTAKTISCFTSCSFSQVDIINFPLFHIPQVNRCQNIIICLIIKRHIKKQKQNLILFNIFGMIITFWALMKISCNAYGVIKVSKESIILSLLVTYWERRLCIFEVVMLLGKNHV